MLPVPRSQCSDCALQSTAQLRGDLRSTHPACTLTRSSPNASLTMHTQPHAEAGCTRDKYTSDLTWIRESATEKQKGTREKQKDTRTEASVKVHDDKTH